VKRRYLLCLLAAWLLIPALVRATDVRATLDRSKVQLGETVTLNLRLQGGDSIGTPDLSALTRDFTILGTSSSTSVSIINGVRSAELTYGIALRPKHVGQLQVPSLSLAGGRTSPLQLEVDAPDPKAIANGGKDVFMEASVDPGKVYVGQQLAYTVRLYFAANLSSGSLDDPQLAGVDVRRLGPDLNYEAQRGGRNYHVIERRYALVPQHAGHITIPSIGFQGEMVDPNDPDSFFGMGTTVTSGTSPVPVDVLPAPTDWGTSAWLPARGLQLTLDGLPADGRLRVGQPLNLTMTLQATGLPYEALPALSLPALDGVTVYPDKPVTGTRNDGQWLIGRRQRSFAVVPDRPGALTLPATTLKWWDVLAGKVEVARIPAHTFTVLPAVGGSVAPTVAASAGAPVTGAAAVKAANGRLPGRHWLALAGAIGLLLCGALGWWLGRRQRRAPPVDGPAAPAPAPGGSARQMRASFMAAARDADPALQSQRLLAWARAERPGLQNLGALSAALASASQRAAIAELQRRHYAGVGDGDPLGLTEVFAKGFEWQEAATDGDNSTLPPLYPFKLH
jgi:hypothetical protein